MIDETRRRMLMGMTATMLGTPRFDQLLRTIAVAPSPQLRKKLTQTLGLMPERPHGAFTTLETVKLARGVRHKIEYLAEPGDVRFLTPADLIRAYLFVPDHAPGERLPAIVAIHQDGAHSHIGKSEPAGLAGDPHLFYGLELFQKGYVVICPDRFEHAERRWVTPNDITSIDPDRDLDLLNHRAGQLLQSGRTSFGKEAYDLMVTTDVLASLEYVDRSRIGAIGHSAGGHNLVLFIFCDSRIKAGVSSCGLFSMMGFFSQRAVKKRLAAFALPGLAQVGDSADYLALVAPRPVMLTRGLWEWGTEGEDRAHSLAHVQETRDMESRARVAYERARASDSLRVTYFDEGGGNHDFPEGVRLQSYAWLDSHLT